MADGEGRERRNWPLDVPAAFDGTDLSVPALRREVGSLLDRAGPDPTAFESALADVPGLGNHTVDATVLSETAVDRIEADGVIEAGGEAVAVAVDASGDAATVVLDGSEDAVAVTVEGGGERAAEAVLEAVTVALEGV